MSHVEHKYKPICQEGALLLAEGILSQASMDWRESDRVLKRHKRQDLLRLKRDVERFFRSKWFYDLTGFNGREIFLQLSDGVDFMSKMYNVGMYGGKFMPMHKGHLHCLEVASRLCDKVYLICTMGGADETRIANEVLRGEISIDEYLTPAFRKEQIKRAAAMFDNVIPVVADLSSCRDANGNEDWDMETPIILAACGEKFDAVFGSEESYAPYFNRAYPEAEYVLVDCDRSDVPISATKIRAMSKEEAKGWIV